MAGALLAWNVTSITVVWRNSLVDIGSHRRQSYMSQLYVTSEQSSEKILVLKPFARHCGGWLPPSPLHQRSCVLFSFFGMSAWLLPANADWSSMASLWITLLIPNTAQNTNGIMHRHYTPPHPHHPLQTNLSSVSSYRWLLSWICLCLCPPTPFNPPILPSITWPLFQKHHSHNTVKAAGGKITTRLIFIQCLLLSWSLSCLAADHVGQLT